ncbi:hypothetical protein GW933_03360 [Candidatus Falkowbacteria bacterium]|uniref:Aromatic hydrocarbon degradation protein n=1 Tax=Candidatus Buchananbacteria bacterium CG10_big_fil_rev_8_21_14_0_10_33_19 TaxID=1974525 RepID=A0A2H0W4R2_9BACT|nr:hypothetical protein [Candidatus Falkowbacteria bacterium]PIS06339.1 MAG: hypothetical protein COT80_02105 [Candidatus Buchananbacteria bacterium CG10_big_fil_rev_8_21_14_0_10_33_19]
MKRSVLLTILISILLSNQCFAGGLNRIGGIGSRAGGMSGAFTAIADDVTLFYYNPAGMSQFETTYIEAGVDVVVPRLKYNGHNSDNDAWHALPYAGVIYPANDRVNIGLGLTVPYGMGASFKKSWPLPETETLLSLTNITPALSLKLCDKFYVGVGLNIGYGQFKYRAPFDVDGIFLPICTDNEASGFGLGTTIGLMYFPTDKLTFGLTYMSELKVNFNGESDISIGPISIRDKFKSDFTFPPRLGLGIAYQFTDRLTVDFDANWYGYSKTVNSMTLQFDKLNFGKTTKLNWQDNFSLHLGARYRLNNDWWLRAGMAYQNSAIPDSTISQLTPDASGWDVAFGLECEKDNFSFGVGTIYGWGENDVEPNFGVRYPGKYEAQTLTVGLQASWKF